MKDRTFEQGLFTGLGRARSLVQFWFAVVLASYRQMYADMEVTDLPAMTRLVISPAWLWGVPIVVLAAVGALIFVRPRRLGPYIATATLVIATTCTTWWFAQKPVNDLAGEIKGP